MKFVALIHEGRKVHKSEPFLCPDCDYKTKDSSNIKRHIQTIHEGIAIWSCATSAGSTDTKLKWTYTVQEYVFRFVNKRILNSCIITLSRPYSVLLNECKIFHCRIGAMMEERPETGHTYRCTL